jgi:predicted metal-dependent hydrolase
LNKEQLKEILNEIKGDLQISEKIKIELKPMKTKAASISLKRNTVRINKNIIPRLDNECIKYLILHELTHYKLKSKYHNGNFYEQLHKKVDDTKAKELERKILTILLEHKYYRYKLSGAFSPCPSQNPKNIKQ